MNRQITVDEALVVVTVVSMVAGCGLAGVVYGVFDNEKLSTRAKVAFWFMVTLTWPLHGTWFLLRGTWFLLKQIRFIPSALLGFFMGFWDLYRYVRPAKVRLPEMRVL